MRWTTMMVWADRFFTSWKLSNVNQTGINLWPFRLHYDLVISPGLVVTYKESRENGGRWNLIRWKICLNANTRNERHLTKLNTPIRMHPVRSGKQKQQSLRSISWPLNETLYRTFRSISTKKHRRPFRTCWKTLPQPTALLTDSLNVQGLAFIFKLQAASRITWLLL